MKKKKDNSKSKIRKIIDNINNNSLDINCNIWIGTDNFYLLPAIYFFNAYYFEVSFVIFNIALDIGFKIKKE